MKMKMVMRDSEDMVKIGRKYRKSRIPLITSIRIRETGVSIKAIKNDEYVEMVFEMSYDISKIFDELCELETVFDDEIFRYDTIVY